MTGQGPVRVPKDVLDELESVRLYARAEAVDIPTLRYVASGTGKPALVVWIDGHPKTTPAGCSTVSRRKAERWAERR